MNSTLTDHVAESIAKIPPVFIDYLKSKGIDGDEAAYKFLYPVLADLPKPAKMKNLPTAAELAVEYIAAGKQIIIWGDYDVDGTTGTALLVNFFHQLGKEVKWHIPDRLEEGYGLNSEWFLDRKKNEIEGDFLLITVDCGISNVEQIEIIQQIGGKVIVTDHHSLPEKAIPDCLILNPSQQTCGFHGEALAGVGVAFYLAAGIRAELSSHSHFTKAVAELNLKQYLAFVALGTVADVVELTPTNRILVRAGIEALVHPYFIGLKELLASCEISGHLISSEDIGYLIGPKINAAGRLGESTIVVRLLTELDKKKARRLARQLTELNTERRQISADNLEKALTMFSQTMVENDKCIIVEGDLHQGVAGIVASRLIDTFRVPAIVFAKNELPDGKMVFTGSARSVEGVNIVAILAQCSNWIEKFGGHEMAAGLTVANDKLEIFKQNFISLMQSAMNEREINPKKQYDILSSVDIIMDSDHLECLRLLEPFGPGNPQPVFHDPGVEIIDSRTVGRDAEHLQVTIRGRYSNLKGIGFGLGQHLKDIQRNPQRKMIFTPTMNRFRGNVNWQVRIIDL